MDIVFLIIGLIVGVVLGYLLSRQIASKDGKGTDVARIENAGLKSTNEQLNIELNSTKKELGDMRTAHPLVPRVFCKRANYGNSSDGRSGCCI